MRHESLKNISRVVVKLGTGILTDSRNRIDPAQMEQLVGQMAALQATGRELVIVTSGAVGAGMGTLGMTRRPTRLEGLQACAAIGQLRLMTEYGRLFGKHGLNVAQVLLTHDDLKHKERHLNARNTLLALLKRKVIPIINENDTVSFTELKFGDNDKLSALAAALIPADLLVILTSVGGVLEHFGTERERIVPIVERIGASIQEHARGTSSVTGTGGMVTKIEAAKIATRSGIPVVIASGLDKGSLAAAAAGENVGTLFVPGVEKLRSRKRWIAFFHHPRGVLTVDEGARQALRIGGKSLLAPGITRVEGVFQRGDVVKICDPDGTEFARGIVGLSAEEISGSSPAGHEVVHRDNLVIL